MLYALRPWSVDSLDGGFIASQFCSVGRSENKNKIPEIPSGGQIKKKIGPLFLSPPVLIYMHGGLL